MSIDEPREKAKYLFLTLGSSRLLEMTLSIADRFDVGQKLFLCTGSMQVEADKFSSPLKFLRAQSFSFQQWREHLTRLWPLFISRIESADRRFGLGKAVCYQLLSALAWAVADFLAAERLLDRVCPSVVIVEHDRHPSESIFCQVARNRGIPTVTLVHGVQSSKDEWEKVKWVPLVADRVVVWGELMRDYFLSHGVQQDRISIGGYPKTKPLSRENYRRAETLLRDPDCLSGGNTVPVVLLLSSNLTMSKKAAELFFAVGARLSGVRLMVRPHPDEPLDWYAEHLPAGLASVQNPKMWSLADSLASASIVVGSGSTACLDALLLSLPLVLIPDDSDSYEDMPLLLAAASSGAAQTAATAEELRCVLDKLLGSKTAVGQSAGSNSFATACAAHLGDDAAEATAAILRGMSDEMAPAPCRGCWST